LFAIFVFGAYALSELAFRPHDPVSMHFRSMVLESGNYSVVHLSAGEWFVVNESDVVVDFEGKVCLLKSPSFIISDLPSRCEPIEKFLYPLIFGGNVLYAQGNNVTIKYCKNCAERYTQFWEQNVWTNVIGFNVGILLAGLCSYYVKTREAKGESDGEAE